MQMTDEVQDSWLDRPWLNKITLNAETILFVLILLLAVFSRFYILGARVQSHDENTHVYYSWRFEHGQGLLHDPLMHGPFQFHLIALTYFMFGDNDFTARTPAALFSIATVAFMWFYRRYLGRAGALAAAVIMLISPYILYYGRYARNEAFVAFYGVVMLWAILRYLETGGARYMYALTVVTALHYASKETSFIYVAQALVFLAAYFIYRVSKTSWADNTLRNLFIIALIVALFFVAGFGVSTFSGRETVELEPADTAAPAVPGEQLTPLTPAGPPALQMTMVILGVLALLAAAYFLIQGYTWKKLCAERSFGLLIILGTMVLPQLSPFPVRFVGQLLNDPTWSIPTNASQVTALSMTNIWHIAVFLVPMFILAIVIGMLWNTREWLINAAIFYALFTVFYTSMFTNGAGFLTGMVGSLGYWLEQQGVNRGSQPWYYYALVQVPVYEYLPALGTILAFGIALARRLTFKKAEKVEQIAALEQQPLQAAADLAGSDIELVEPEVIVLSQADEEEKAPVLPLLGFWAITSLIAYSVAGEKMPWLTVHITLGMILCAGWSIGQLINTTDWSAFRARRGWLVLALLPVFLLSLLAVLGSLLGPRPPFQGKMLDQLQDTSTFVTSLLAAIASGVGLFYMVKNWKIGQLVRIMALFFFALAGFLTTHTAIQSSYINYDNANELLVYAHSARGVKDALAQIEEISYRTTNGLAMQVAYDNETSYPYWWYLRNYTNTRYFGSDPTRSLREAPVILVGDANYGKIESVVGSSYYRFDYIRLWWPNQDYFGLTWERVWNALKDRNMRAALFQIWLNRDYTLYGKALNRDMSLPNWSPAARMRLYVRKDLVAQMWNYGVAPSPEALEPQDPFDTTKQLKLTADMVIGTSGNQPGQFQRPRDLAVAPDGSLYIADTENHRIQHLAVDGTVLHVWGSYGDTATGSAPSGTFNQPWGIAVGPDGFVYVADTWNHRIQKFAADGTFISMWGYFGQGEQPEAFWGPRDVAVDSDNRVFVTDTGNKRVVVFDANGVYQTQFGGAGLLPGQFDEPVGVAVDASGQVFVVDTWNQRIQVFAESEEGNFMPLRSWDMMAWYGQSLDNKPYMAVDNRGNVFVVEPEGYRVLWLSDKGEARHFWGDFGAGLDTFGLPASVAVDANGGIWVSDAGNGRLMHFVLPAE